MPDEPVTLEFLAAQQRQLLEGQRRLANQIATVENKLAIMQDDLHLLVASGTRQNNVSKSLLEMIDRLDARVRRLENPPAE